MAGIIGAAFAPMIAIWLATFNIVWPTLVSLGDPLYPCFLVSTEKEHKFSCDKQWTTSNQNDLDILFHLILLQQNQ
jgi:hypothetical protein